MANSSSATLKDPDQGKRHKECIICGLGAVVFILDILCGIAKLLNALINSHAWSV